MADASIQWTDATGAATLVNAHTGTPGCRFADWRPIPAAIGPKAPTMATGQRHSFRFRTQQGAYFEFRDIPESSMSLMTRLALHLDDGGTATVNTGDASSRSYTVCLAPDAEVPLPQLSDELLLWYSMAFTVINVGSSAEMLCIHF